jgi:hypothetical protein
MPLRTSWQRVHGSDSTPEITGYKSLRLTVTGVY